MGRGFRTHHGNALPLSYIGTLNYTTLQLNYVGREGLAPPKVRDRYIYSVVPLLLSHLPKKLTN